MTRGCRLLAVVSVILSTPVHGGAFIPSSCGDGGDKPHPMPAPEHLPIEASQPASGSSESAGTPEPQSSTTKSYSRGQSCDCSLSTTTALSSGNSSTDPSNSFSLSGATSDIALQLYDRYLAGDEIDQLELEEVPERVQDRLDNASMGFEDLPGLMQRALLWDSGFALTSDNQALRVWTFDEASMAEIAVSSEEFSSAGCETQLCSNPNSSTVQIYSSCSRGPADVLAVSKCVVEAFDSDNEASEAVWSVGGNSTAIPEILVVRNSGSTDCGCEFSLYSIRTSNAKSETASGECPTNGESVSLIIPCYGNDTIPESITTRMTTPESSAWVTSWIRQFKTSSTTKESSRSNSKGSSSTSTGSGDGSHHGLTWWWLLFILPIILLLIAGIVACRHCHRLSRMNTVNDNTTYIFVGGRMWAVEDEHAGRGVTYWIRFANWCRKTFNFFN